MKRLFETAAGTRWGLGAGTEGAGFRVHIERCGETDGRAVVVRQHPRGTLLIKVDGIVRPVRVDTDRDRVWLSRASTSDPRSTTVALTRVEERPSRAGADVGRVRAPMTGRIVLVYVAPGSEVAKGQPLLVVEAMKMEHVLTAPRAGVVAQVFGVPGDLVEGGAELVTLEDPPSPPARSRGDAP